MLRLIAALALLLPPLAWAQQPQQPLTPAMEALQQSVIDLTGQKLEWQARAIELQRKVAELEKAAAAAKPAEPPKP